MSNHDIKLEGIYFEPHQSGESDVMIITFQDTRGYSISVSKDDNKLTIASKLNMLADAIIAEPVDNIPANTIH